MKRRRNPGKMATRYGSGPEGGKGEKSRSERLLFWVELVAGTLAIGAILYGALRGPVKSFFSDAASGRVEVVVAGVENQAERMTTAGVEMVQTRATTPRIDVTLRNTGGSSVLLTEARITVEDSAWLPMCIIPGAGPVPVAGRYAVQLPFLPSGGERTVVKPLHDIVPAGGVDRFQVYFGATRFGEDTNLYALHVTVGTEGGTSVDAGRFVLGVPTTVNRGGWILPEDDRALSNRPIGPSDRLASSWCYRYNLASVRRIVSRPGKRTAEIAALADLQVASDWSRWADDRPPRQAVAPLLGDEELQYGPLVAVFAAEQAGDRSLVERTRRRAAEILLDRVEHELVEGTAFFPELAAMQAHASLSLVPSSRGRDLLARAEARQQEREEEFEEETLG